MLVLFPWFSAAAALLVVVLAASLRGRLYATFTGVILTVQTLISCALVHSFASLASSVSLPGILAVYAYLQLVVYLNFAFLVRPRMRPWWFRVLVNLPASFFTAGTLLAMPWAIVAAFGGEPYGFFIPYAIAAFGLVQSLAHRFEEIDVTLDDAPAPALARCSLGSTRVNRPLRIVQITDPHLGPFMSESRLHEVAVRAVAADPDLVLLTGDFLTMESHHAREALARALSPLSALPGRVFACRGNHDLEAPDTVANALADVGAILLIDDAALIDTPAGPVQILGVDFHFKDRAQRTRAACTAHPRIPGHLRLVLLHDPGAFRHLPDGEADIVLSGHTHGGQLGLLTLGLPHTFVSAFTKIPDHGFWALGRNRLYVHRGTGHYGFPLRVGVPSEESLLRIHTAYPRMISP